MLNTNRINKVLEKVLEERKDNIVRLKLDYYFAQKIYPHDKKKEIKELDKEIIRYQGEIDVERAKSQKERNKERLIHFDSLLNKKTIKKNELEQKFTLIDKDIEKTEFQIEFEERLIETTEECIKDNSKLNAYDVQKNIQKQDNKQETN